MRLGRSLALPKNRRGETFSSWRFSTCIARSASKLNGKANFVAREIVSVSWRLMCHREDRFAARSML
jgi:hypothetical protein